MAKIDITPLGDRVLVAPVIPVEKTASGIIIPEEARQRINEGKVVAVGTLNEDVKVKVGDKVRFNYSYESIEVDGIEYYVIKSEDLLAVIK